MNPGFLLSRGTLGVCRSCRRSLLRQFSTSRAGFASPYQAYPLPARQTPPQPRNASVPDTSIAHPVQAPLPRVHETRPPGPDDGVKDASLSEGQAQRSDPALAPSSSSTASPPSRQPPLSSSEPSSSASSASTSPQPPRRSKLRAPRKAAMKLTPAAVTQIRALLEGPDPKLLKVGVRNRGCSGLAYHLEYVDKAGAFDEAIEQDGVRVLVDSKALFSIIGSEMDWIEDKLSQRFVFRNPNISGLPSPLSRLRHGRPRRRRAVLTSRRGAMRLRRKLHGIRRGGRKTDYRVQEAVRRSDSHAAGPRETEHLQTLNRNLHGRCMHIAYQRSTVPTGQNAPQTQQWLEPARHFGFIPLLNGCILLGCPTRPNLGFLTTFSWLLSFSSTTASSGLRVPLQVATRIWQNEDRDQSYPSPPRRPYRQDELSVEQLSVQPCLGSW